MFGALLAAVARARHASKASKGGALKGFIWRMMLEMCTTEPTFIFYYANSSATDSRNTSLLYVGSESRRLCRTPVTVDRVVGRMACNTSCFK